MTDIRYMVWCGLSNNALGDCATLEEANEELKWLKDNNPDGLFFLIPYDDNGIIVEDNNA